MDGALAGAVAAILAAAAPAAGQEDPRTHTVLIERFAYSPAEVVAAPGDTIEWVNVDLVPHTATALDGDWDTGVLRTGRVGSVTVGREGVIAYTCVYHSTMRGTVVVRSADSR